MAIILVAATSALVLVLEIVAGRLMAPHVGVSLDTFTGIIGTILAGIAAGAYAGGRLADRGDPLRLIAQALFYGGGLTWLSIPIVNALGPQLGAGPVASVLLSAAGFFLPAAVLSSVGPLVAKLTLGSLDKTGEVVGQLSAAGTFGALIGTFGTGFVLITILAVRTIIIGVGAALVLAGLALFAMSRRGRPGLPEVLGIVVLGIASFAAGSPCDYTTNYYCVRIVADAADDPDGRANGRSLILDSTRHAHVDLEDPEFMDVRYMRLFVDAIDAMPAGPLRVLHIGGGGFSLPRYLETVRPGSTNMVLELDAGLVEIARAELGFVDTGTTDVLTGDARVHLDDLPTDGFDLVVGDAFGGASVPWHLTTVEVMHEIDRLLAPDGVYVMNVIDGQENRFARAQVATLQEVFAQLAVVEPAGGVGRTASNQMIMAAHRPTLDLSVDPADGRLISGPEVDDFIGDGVNVLTDNFAPVDQLLG